MLDARGNVEHFPLTHRDLFPANQKPQRALKHVRHLLARVHVHRYETAPLHVALDEHFSIADDNFA